MRISVLFCSHADGTDVFHSCAFGGLLMRAISSLLCFITLALHVHVLMWPIMVFRGHRVRWTGCVPWKSRL